MDAVSIQNELEFDQVSPNRPTDPFNGFNSCVYSPALFVKAVKAVADAFDHYGITIKIMGPEALAADEMRYINALRADPAALADVDLYNIHGTVPATFATALAVDKKKGWMTETSGEAATWDGALSLARNAQTALVQGDASAWLYWQTSESATATSATTTSLTAAARTDQPKYVAAKQCFRYVRPGAMRIGATPTDAAGVFASAFVQEQQHTLTTVLINSGTTAQTINLHLAGGVHVSTFNIARESSAGTLWQDVGPITVSGDNATFTLPAKSILTLVGAEQTIAQTPFGGTPVSVGLSGTTTIQAENYDLGGEGVAYHDVEKANLGGAFRTSEGVDVQKTRDTGGGFNVGYAKAGEWIEYTIDVQTAGNYDLSFRIASATADGKFHAEVDGANVTGALTMPNTGGSQKWITLVKPKVTLTAGIHVLRVAMDTSAGGGASIGNFNYLTIAPAAPIPGGASILIQAEDFDAGVEGVAYHDVDAANLGGKYRSTGVDIQSTTDAGGGYNLGYVKAGEWLKYTLDVATAGAYAIDFRVASAGSNGKFHLEIDGINVTGAMTIPNTGGWQNWTTLSKSAIDLSAGSHVLRLVMDANGSTGSVGNFNWLKLRTS
jgi:hypothetical protein